MIFGLGNRQKLKEDMSLSNLGTVALHAAKVPTNVFSSTLICILTLDYGSLVHVKNNAKCSAGVEHSAILFTYIKRLSVLKAGPEITMPP